MKFTNQLCEACAKFLQNLMTLPTLNAFVEEENWDIYPEYRNIISKPSSLGKVLFELKEKRYKNVQEFIYNIRLVFINTIVYFFNDPPLRKKAYRALELFNQHLLSNLSSVLTQSFGFSNAQVHALIRYRIGSQKVVQECRNVIDGLLKLKSAFYFVRPVDKYGVQLKDYSTYVSKPMDLGSINVKLNQNEFSNVSEFVETIKLVYNNCIKYYTGTNQSPELIQEAQNSLKILSNLYKKRLKAMQAATPAQIAPVPSTLSAAPGEVAKFELSSADKARFNQNLSGKLKIKCVTLLKTLMQDRNCFYFLTPVDYKSMQLPDYPKIVKTPMDLGTIKQRLLGDKYETISEFLGKILLVFNNALLFNTQETPNFPIRTMTKQAHAKFKKLLLATFSKLEIKTAAKSDALVTASPQAKETRPFPGLKLIRLMDKVMRQSAAAPFLTHLEGVSSSLTDIRETLKNKGYKSLSDFGKSLQNLFGQVLKLPTHKGVHDLAESLLAIFVKNIKTIPHKLLLKYGVDIDQSNIYIDYTGVTTTTPAVQASPPTPSQPPPPIPQVPVSTKSQPKKRSGSHALNDAPKPVSVPVTKKLKLPTAPPVVQEVKRIKVKTKKRKEAPTPIPATSPEPILIKNPKKKRKKSAPTPSPDASGTVFTAPARPENMVLPEYLVPVEKVLQKLSKHEFSKYLFGLPVLETYIDDLFRETYKSIISEPMDLQTVFERMYSSKVYYRQVEDVFADVNKIFDNAITFNSNNEAEDLAAKATVHQAKHMKLFFKHLWAERDGAHSPEYYSNLLMQLYKDDKLDINLGKLDAFDLEKEDASNNKVNINDFVTPLHYTDDKLSEAQLSLYMYGSEVMDFQRLGKGQSTYSGDGILQADDARKIYNERERRRVQKTLRNERESSVADLSLKNINLNSLTRLVNRLTHPNRRAVNHYFLFPFDFNAANQPKYPQIIRHPMDFNTLKLNLETKKYKFLRDFVRDTRLVFRNVFLFNKGNETEYNLKIRRSALILSTTFEKYFADFTLNLFEKRRRLDLSQRLKQEQEKLYISPVESPEKLNLAVKPELTLNVANNINLAQPSLQLNVPNFTQQIPQSTQMGMFGKVKRVREKEQLKEKEKKMMDDIAWAMRLSEARAILVSSNIEVPPADETVGVSNESLVKIDQDFSFEIAAVKNKRKKLARKLLPVHPMFAA